MMKYYISDLHFGHKNVIKFDKRPFFSVDDMERTIIENWNNRVTNNDDVYILGDISWYDLKGTIRVIKKLNGKLHLVKGNHDVYCNEQEFRKLFVEIKDYIEIPNIRINGKTRKMTGINAGLVLCHYPIPCFKNNYRGWYHFHGHVHNSYDADVMDGAKEELSVHYKKPMNMYNVGCMLDYMDYTPRTIEEIIGLSTTKNASSTTSTSTTEKENRAGNSKAEGKSKSLPKAKK